VRWDDLFDDLEAQADALELAERAGEIDERSRIEYAAITLLDRVRGAHGRWAGVRVLGGASFAGHVCRVGSDWVLIDDGVGRESLVLLSAVRSVHGLDRYADVTTGTAAPVSARLSWRSVLRGIARDRSGVHVHLVDGSGLDATLDRVGADFVELALHPAGEPRRRGEVRERVLVPASALAAVVRGPA
jgi:hypothetical protein